jgi:hypothetical protein
LQELVYKQGSAGITKATVSIVFHNNEPANGPSGYEDKEYITVTRQVCGHVFWWWLEGSHSMAWLGRLLLLGFLGKQGYRVASASCCPGSNCDADWQHSSTVVGRR